MELKFQVDLFLEGNIMPRIPKRQPVARTITPQIPSRTIERTSILGESTQLIGKTLQEVGEQIKVSKSISERTNAQNVLNSSILDIQTRAANDNDISEKKQREYDFELDKSISASSKNISIPSERSMFEQEARAKTDISKVKIKSSFNKKIIDKGKVDLEIYLEGKENEFVQAQSANEKQVILSERNMKMKEAVAAGYLEPADATKQLHELDKSWSKSQVEYDIATNPELARQLLNEKAYPNLSEIERIEELKNVDKEMKKRSVTIENEVYAKFINEELSVDEVLAVSFPKEDGGIGSKTAKTIISQLERRQKAEVKDISEDNKTAKKYVELIDRMITDPSDKFNAKKVLTDSMADGVIQKEEAQKMSEINATLNDLKWNKKGDPLTNSVKKIKSWFGDNNPSDEQLATSLRKLINDDQSETDPQAVSDTIIDDVKASNNPDFKKYKVNDVEVLSNGRSVKVVGFFPNGDPDVEFIK